MLVLRSSCSLVLLLVVLFLPVLVLPILLLVLLVPVLTGARAAARLVLCVFALTLPLSLHSMCVRASFVCARADTSPLPPLFVRARSFCTRAHN